MNVLKKQWFLIVLVLAILLGGLFPTQGSQLNPNKITTICLVIMLFFLSGLSLPTETLREDMKDIRLHGFIQVFIFIVTPIYFFLTAFPFKNVMDGQLIVGIYALAVLPTTVSTCIVFTQLSGGNTIGAVFNASFSNLAGVFISPLLLTLFLNTSSHPLPMKELLNIFQGLVLQICVPFGIGQGFHMMLKSWAKKHKKKIGVMSNIFVLCIIFFSVAKSVENNSFQKYWKELLWPFAFLAVSHLILLALSYYGAKRIGLSRQNIITAIYCAPQKTIAVGIPLLSTYFASQPKLMGIAILPILFYHPWQLFIAGIIRNSSFIQSGLKE